MNLLAENREGRSLEQLPDAVVVRRICAGDPALFELIMRRYNRRLFRIARGILGNDADAEDAVQEAYVRAYFKLPQFRGPDGFAGWLCRIATNEALMRRRRPRLELAADPEEGDMTLRQVSDETPETRLHERQLQGLLQQAIDGLPEVYRAAFVLREVEQMSLAETAACLGIEAATVKTRVHRARRLIQRDLTGEMAALLSGVYAFDGERCDRLVAAVFARVEIGVAPGKR